MIYQAPTQGRGRNLYTNADKVYNTFVQACSQLKISVQQPHFIETENEADRAEVE
jgi:hypothetical protein